MEYKIIDCKNYKIHTIKTDKFKTCLMEIMFKNKTDRNKFTQLNVLTDMLNSSSKRHKTRREMNIALENLYNASCRGVVSNVGNSHIISFLTDFLNPKYCCEGYLEDVINFSIDLIKNPNISNGKFDNTNFNIVKNKLKSEIESIKENGPKFALRRAFINMDENSLTSCSKLGTLEELDKINNSNLVDTYNDLINNYQCDIYVIGNLDMDLVVDIIKKNFDCKKNIIKDDLFIDNKEYKEVKNIRETGKYEQDTFVMIYNLNGLTKRERDYVLHLYNIIFGNGSLTSKLSKYLREENSLCYTVSSMYMKYDKLLVVNAGITEKDKDKCIKLVNKAMDEMIKGDFSDEDFINAKLSIESSIRISEDNMGSIINNYLFNELDNLELFNKRLEIFNSITKDEIIEVAKKIKLNTIYILAGED